MSAHKSVHHLRRLKEQGERIAMLTAYDYVTAMLLERAGIDAVLVGDTCTEVFAGRDSTIRMTLAEMRYHTGIVSRALTTTLLISDLPFLSLRSGSDAALRQAGLLVQAGANAVKLEGAGEVVEIARRMVELGIPVMGHLGLKPQSVEQTGGYRVYGKTAEERTKIVDDARALEQAGAFALVLELVPPEVAGDVTQALTIPTIGIGAGLKTDGQILVVNDVLGLTSGRVPKFVKQYADLQQHMTEAFQSYIHEVKDGAFPEKQD